MADYKIQGEASLDITKAEQGLTKLGRTAEKTTQTIAQQSAKASKAAEGIGDGINVGAQKFSRAESQISASIKRATTQLELMGKTASQRLEFRINERGLDASKFEPALRKLRELEKAQFQVNKETQRFGSVADQARSQLASFAAAAAGVISVRSFVQAADAVTQLQNNLKLAAGGAVEAQAAYTALFEIAQRSRVSFTELGGTFASVSRAAGELGLSQRQLLSLTEAIGNAVTISGSSAQASSAALVQLSQGLASGVLRGEELNSIMEQTPRLARAIADGLGVPIGKLREMGQEGELTAQRVISALQSQSKVLSGEVRDSVTTLGQAFTQLGNSATVLVGEFDRVSGVTSFMATEIQGASKALDNITQALRGTEAAGKQTAIFADAISVAFEAVTVVGANVAYVIKQIGNEIGGMAAQAAAVATLNFGQAAAIRREMVADAEKARADIDALERRVLNTRRLNGIAQDKTAGLDTRAEDARLNRLAGSVDKVAVSTQKATKSTKAMGDEFASVREVAREWERVVESFTKATAAADAESIGLTKSQAQLIEYLGSPAYLQASEAMRQVALSAAYGAIAAEQSADATKRQTEALQELAKAEQDRINAAERSASGVQDQVQKLLDEERALTIAAASNISLAQAIEEVNIARLREQQAQLMAQGDRDAEVLAIQKEIDARKQLQQAIGRQEARDEAKKAADAAQKEWEKTADSIERTLTDALMRGFEGGKSFGENFADSLVNTFKTYVAKEIASSLSKALMSAFSGQGGGFNLGSLFGGGGQGGFNWGDLISKGWNYLTGGSAAAAASSLGTAAGTGFGVSAGGTGFGVTAAGTGYGVAATTAGATTVATTGAASGASAAGAGALAAVPVVGWIAAAVMAADALYKKGYNRDALKGVGESNDYKYSAENAARGLLDGLGFSKKWADILSGTVRMASLFGRRLKQEGYEVDISGRNVDVEQYAYYKGGLFRSNKTVRGAADPDAVESLTFQVENVRESSKAMAKALGFSGDALDDFTGRMRVNLKGAEDSAEAAKRYEEALMELQREMLNSVTGLDMSKEEFKKWINGINQSIADAGISTQGIADILVQGMMGRLSQQEVGDQLADMIVGGIYNSIASNYAAQIASVFTAQIITPIFTALAAGVPISQAISQQAIANVVQTAQQAAAAMNAIFSDPGFRSAISGIQQAIGGVSAAVTSVRIPKFGSARTAASNAAAQSAAQAANQEAQERYNLETKLLQLLGNTARLRERELAGLSASNRALQLRIWAIEDAQAAVDSATSALDGAKDAIDGAMSALERAVNKQKEKLQTQLDTALEAESALNDVFQTLRDNIKELRGEVDSTAGISAEDGRNRIQQAISGAIKLSNDELVDAIDAVRGGLENEVFGSQFERDRAFLRFASELETLAGVTEDGLSEAERQVMLLEEQIAALDAQAEISKQQVEALFGIDNSVKTVAQAVGSLNTAMAGYAQAVTAQNAAMAAYAQAVAAAQQVATSAGAAPSSSGGGGGYSGGRGGGYSAPKPAAAKQWTADGYWSKNPDLQKEFVAANLQNSPQFNQDPALSARDEYLRWHWANYGQKERRAYAKGGYYPGGLALVGEEGPELINFRNPGQVYTASQTAELLKAGGDKEVVKAIESLRADQRAQSASMVRMQSQLNKIFSRWDVDGVPEKRVTA